MDKKVIASKMLKLAKDLTALQGSRLFIVKADQTLDTLKDICANLDTLKDICANNAADSALLGSDGAEAVQAYRKVYTMLHRLQQDIPRVIGTAF